MPNIIKYIQVLALVLITVYYTDTAYQIYQSIDINADILNQGYEELEYKWNRVNKYGSTYFALPSVLYF